jgi:preprotein translocase subunit SecE
MIGKTSEFLANVKAELKKVTWPTRKDTYASTMVVIMLVIISAVFLGGIDIVLSRLIRLILG